MIELGRTLKAAREAKGLTASQVADVTHMLVQVVEGLEKEDFSRIVAPIYGRGFVKLYCEAVGLEPKPLVDAFMELYNGGRRPADRAPSAPPEPPRGPRACRGTPRRHLRPGHPGGKLARARPHVPERGKRDLR